MFHFHHHIQHFTGPVGRLLRPRRKHKSRGCEQIFDKFKDQAGPRGDARPVPHMRCPGPVGQKSYQGPGCTSRWGPLVGPCGYPPAPGRKPAL